MTSAVQSFISAYGSGLPLPSAPSDPVILKSALDAALTKKIDLTGDASRALVRAKTLSVAASVARPLEAHFGDMINLADEGALGNDLDVTANDQAIARALARCYTDGARPIFAPPGMYRANNFAITQWGVSLFGAGQGTSLFRPQGDGDFISLGTQQSITRNINVQDIGGIYNHVPAAGSSFIHVHGAGAVNIARIACGDPTVAQSGGRHFIVVDNYGNGAQISIDNVIGVNYAGDGIGIGPLSHYVPNEIFIGRTTLSTGNRGIVVFFCSGLYVEGYVSIFNMANVGVGLIPGAAQLDQYPGMNPGLYPPNIYGAEFYTVNADSCGDAGWYFGGTATIADLLMDNCIGSSCLRGLDATTQTMIIDGWRNHSFKATNNRDWGGIINSPNVVNWSSNFGEYWCNNTAQSPNVGGFAAANGTKGFHLIGNKSGKGGWVGRGGKNAPALPNYQTVGYLIDGACDDLVAALNRSIGNTNPYNFPAASASKAFFGNMQS